MSDAGAVLSAELADFTVLNPAFGRGGSVRNWGGMLARSL